MENGNWLSGTTMPISGEKGKGVRGLCRMPA
jgi:hypothetical protein